MAFFDKLGETISSKSKDVAKKAKDFAEIASLNSQVNSQEDIITKTYIEIGRSYYEANQGNIDNLYTTQFETIKAAQETINQLKENIKNIKGVDICQNCGAEIPAASTFCGICGTKVIIENETRSE